MKKSSSPASKGQGPLRATRQFGANTINVSPDSCIFRVISTSPSPLRRAASADITTAQYLNGEWPTTNDSIHSINSSFKEDVSTQTPDEWAATTDHYHSRRRSQHTRSWSVDDQQQQAFRINQLKRMMSTPPSCCKPISNGHCTTPTKFRIQRGSVEGLNQEIETLVFTASSQCVQACCTPPRDGRRPPLIEILSHNMQTQTPSSFSDMQLDEDDVNVETLKPAPIREPPDGCCEQQENEDSKMSLPIVKEPLLSATTLIPSTNSAFKSYCSRQLPLKVSYEKALQPD